MRTTKKKGKREMTKLALMITPEGKVLELDLQENELEKLQEAVQGWIEPVSFVGFTMWVNEEGLLRDDLAPNAVAYGFYPTPIMGNIVFTGATDENGDTLPLDEKDAKTIRKIAKSCRLLLA
jgi:hypothetical protein